MSFIKFATKWINKNVPVSEVYGDAIQKDLIRIVNTIRESGHSGASFNVLINCLIRLLEDYAEQS